MRDFSKVSPSLWRSKKFRILPSDDARYMYLYLLTNQHQNSAGAYQLPPAYAAYDLGWDLERYLATLGQMVDAGLVEVDGETDEILIANWFKHNPPMNPKHRIGTISVLNRLESKRLHEIGVANLELISPDQKPHPDDENQTFSTPESREVFTAFKKRNGKAV